MRKNYPVFYNYYDPEIINFFYQKLGRDISFNIASRSSEYQGMVIYSILWEYRCRFWYCHYDRHWID